MKFKGVFTKGFDKDLKIIRKKNPGDLDYILSAIENILLDDPLSSGTKKLQCFEYYRHRIGKYRIIFDLHEPDTLVFLAIDRRSLIYDKLKKRFNKC